jgi:hypothetical protein
MAPPMSAGQSCSGSARRALAVDDGVEDGNRLRLLVVGVEEPSERLVCARRGRQVSTRNVLGSCMPGSAVVLQSPFCGGDGEADI